MFLLVKYCLIYQKQMMRAVTELLLETLVDLGDEELKIFKWYLQQAEILKDFAAIPKSLLEKADRLDTVDLIVKTYNEQSVEVIKKVLSKINRNDLMQGLSNISQGPKCKSSNLQCEKPKFWFVENVGFEAFFSLFIFQFLCMMLERLWRPAKHLPFNHRLHLFQPIANKVKV